MYKYFNNPLIINFTVGILEIYRPHVNIYNNYKHIINENQLDKIKNNNWD